MKQQPVPLYLHTEGKCWFVSFHSCVIPVLLSQLNSVNWGVIGDTQRTQYKVSELFFSEALET